MTNDGKFWGPVCDGDRVVAWSRVDSPVPGAVEAMHDGVPMRFLRFRDGAIVRLGDAERKEIADAEAAAAAQREADAKADAKATLAAADENARKAAEAEADSLAKVEAVRSATSVEAKLDAVIAYLGIK